MLDDWGTIAKTAFPLILKHGVPMLEKLYTKLSGRKIPESYKNVMETGKSIASNLVSSLIGGDEGINPID